MIFTLQVFHLIQELEDARKSLGIKERELLDLQEKLNIKERVSSFVLPFSGFV